MGRTILYGKLGRSMPLTLAKCGTLGGDIEMTATLVALAKRYPDDDFVLIGRNSGESAFDAGLPENVFNPWTDWKPELKERLEALGVARGGNFTPEQQHWHATAIDSLTREWFQRADGIVMWVGQHGTSNHPIPKVDDRSVLTKPQDAFMHYAGYLLRGVNTWRDLRGPDKYEPIFLNADPRNYLKMRDLKHRLNHPVLTQYEFEHGIKHERYGDPAPYGDVWQGKVFNVYSRLELNALLPGTPSGDLLPFNDSWDDRGHFGVVINEARTIGIPERRGRLHAMLNWIMPLYPKFIHGTWSQDSQRIIRYAWDPHFNPTSLPWTDYAKTMHRVRCTFTTPSSGSGWATTKPWEAFGLGVVCFFHPDYDTQNHILADAPPSLHDWLRVKSPEQLRDRVYHLSTPAGRKDWEILIKLQREHFNANVGINGAPPMFMQMIDDRLENR